MMSSDYSFKLVMLDSERLSKY